MARFVRTVMDVLLVFIGGPIVLMMAFIKGRLDRRREAQGAVVQPAPITGITTATVTGVADDYTVTVSVTVTKNTPDKEAGVEIAVEGAVERTAP